MLDGDEVSKAYKLASEAFTRDVTTFFSMSFTMRFKSFKRSSTVIFNYPNKPSRVEAVLSLVAMRFFRVCSVLSKDIS